MNSIITEFEERICLITLNRPQKYNAFDDQLLQELQTALDLAIANPEVRIILLKGHGKHFSAGADLHWMQRMVDLSEEENIADALLLAKVIHTLYHSPKPTIAMVQGSALGGGAGLVAACDIAIASDNAQFCFSEVKLGLIPSVISPYVIESLGPRTAKALFLSAEVFDAHKALSINLIQHVVSDQTLHDFTLNYAKKMMNLAPLALQDVKRLVANVQNKPIDDSLIHQTAEWIAKKRISPEGQTGLKAFLNKQQPEWN